MQPRYPKIDDFSSIEELQNLSPKDLKILLTLNRIDYRGCVEKQELVDRVTRLWEDNNEQKKGKTAVRSTVTIRTNYNIKQFIIPICY